VRRAAESVGYHVDYERGYTAGESDFTTDIVQMRQKGVQMLYFISADVPTIVHVLQAAAQQQWHPALIAVGAGNAIYDPAFIKMAGPLAEGVYGDQGSALFFNPEDARAIPGVALYQEWMTKIGQGSRMDLYSAWGWGQALLAVQALKGAGPRLTRPAFLKALRSIHAFDAGGMFARTDPAAKSPQTCYVMLRVDKQRFHRIDTPADRFRCDAPYYYVKS
jgi:ABC-type branched-subunit amino acid transport system substrate-binding protein